jgi:hypothetical protein
MPRATALTEMERVAGSQLDPSAAALIREAVAAQS